MKALNRRFIFTEKWTSWELDFMRARQIRRLIWEVEDFKRKEGEEDIITLICLICKDNFNSTNIKDKVCRRCLEA